MPWIAHRRRGGEFGHHSFVFALVTPALLPLALSTSSFSHFLVLRFRSRLLLSRMSEHPRSPIGTSVDTTVPRYRLLSSLLRPAPTSILTAGRLLCL